MMDRILGRFDAATIRGFLEAAGVLRELERKGFQSLDVALECSGVVLPHIVLCGHKGGARWALLDACVGEAVVRPDFFARRGYRMERSLELAVVHWVREQDPTVQFAPDRPRLPLQQHPGLGVLRQAFRVVVQMASTLGKDGVASVPKFLHDAIIFFHSRLFLFLDGNEQGRFEALVRDLRPLSLGDASLALAGACVHDAQGTVVRWSPGYQVFPISPAAAAYFHSGPYAAQAAAALQAGSFSYDAAAVARTRAELRKTVAA